jgi:pSer/pThr/pTyr-binding forkhead associated (FHA) protein/tetratricopeptide (TPR) repeat protein
MSARRDRCFLIIKAPNGDVREVPLTDVPIVIGRDESADIRVDDKKISRRHASFKLMDGEPWVEDLGSSNGVRLNGKRVDTRTKFGPNDQLRVGSFFVTVKGPSEATASSMFDQPPRTEARKKPVVEKTSDPSTRGKKRDESLPSITGRDDPVKGRRFDVQRGENIVGRLEECDIPILDGSVSRQHARIVFSRDRVTVTDLGSSNGTFVNDTRVDMAELAHADRLRAGNINFDVELPQVLRSRATGPVATRARPAAAAPAAADRRWIVLGAVGLFMAAFVLTTTVLWKLRQRSRADAIEVPALAMTADAGSARVDPPPPPSRSVPPPPRSAPPPPRSAPPPPRSVATPPPRTAPPPPPVPVPVPIPAAADGRQPPPLAAAAQFLPVITATSPYARKDADGLPENLPLVPVAFDFEGFVVQQIEAAKGCEAKGDFRCLKVAVADLLERDPINSDGLQILDRMKKFERAEGLLAEADRFEASGDFAGALEVLMDIPPDVPQAEQAKKRVQDLEDDAIEQELARAKAELKKEKSLKRALERFKRVLELDPESVEALEGVRAAEQKLRTKKIEFEAYEPRRKVETQEPKATDKDALAKFYDGEAKLVGIAQTYATGRVQEALERTKGVERAARGPKRKRARRMREAMERIKPQYERARAEISNDPSRAWQQLVVLQSHEAEILPKSMKSHLVRDLEVAIGESFGQRGTSMFDRGRYEEAFQLWVSGYKIDDTNPKVLAGLEKLEGKGRRMAEEAELAGQRGERDVCERWTRITKVVRAESDVYKKAKTRALEACR